MNSTRDNSFYPDFLQYEEEPFIMTTNNKRKRFGEESDISFLENDANDDVVISKEKSTTNNNGKLINSELRRQIHIQSEQKRRAQIKDGFEDLRNELPSCLNKKMSKVALLHRTVQHIQHLKNTQMTIYAELERLITENEQLRKFQENVVQKQSLEKIYSSL
ncbi:uncharacterized protein EV154DRAFT_438359 [Mucor mucedo]|uniref:uncharacterized protein n=1 Tax=Mucor mucedo TaxID=29922 RepID=UPI00221EA642|nr:uncharacterized protein EV154DRAFT_438359 [Mucor mucedo]KAI7894461.1 hypothetical protein EV154DRAFT_438359 [Mucor mucedo]